VQQGAHGCAQLVGGERLVKDGYVNG